MYSMRDVEVLDLTAELAQTFSTMPGCPGERRYEPLHAKWLLQLLQQGKFYSPCWADVLDTTTGKVWRGNGMHSSTMLFGLPPERFPIGLKVVLQHWVTDDIAHDMFAIFESFDS